MVGLKVINIAIRFLLELCLLIAIGYWGFKTSSGWFLKILLGIGTPVFVAVIWGLFVSPKATFHLNIFQQLGLEAILFGSGVAMLYSTKDYFLAWSFATIVVINRILMLLWGQ